MSSLQASLLAWYRRHRRRLPWRDRPEPYRVWISELMLQQTQVATVLPYFERFVERFPDVRALAAASEEAVLACWSGLGYYRRARALHQAAQRIVSERGGRFPEDLEGWLELPGVGRYTAGAVLSIAFEKRLPILDGNVARVLSRLFAVEGPPRATATEKRLWELAASILPARRVGDFNQALMELGALVCAPKAPRCLVCPLQDRCEAHRQGREEDYPAPAARAKSVAVTMAAAVVAREGRLLLYRRSGEELMRGLWELPLAECRAGEAPSDAVAREGRERYGLRLEPGREIGRVRHAIMNRRITLHAFAAELREGPDGDGRDHRWVSPDELAALPVSSMVHKVLRAAKLGGSAFGSARRGLL